MSNHPCQQTSSGNLLDARRIIATDCGSTTTKAILFEKKDDRWHTVARGEAPTTVEKPVCDVTIGARNAFTEIQETTGIKLLHPDSEDQQANPLIIGSDDKEDDKSGVCGYVSTSSAGGGLQMIVAGVVETMTAESARRAALGAGAIVMDTISIDDGRQLHERVERIRHLRPDIILLAGGTDGGSLDHPLELAETILKADPRPRFGDTLRIPIIFAANKEAREEAKELLGDRFSFRAIENIRPALETENLEPAREAIHESFLSHVMSHAPGYGKLMDWTSVPIMPTPMGFGAMVKIAGQLRNQSIVAVDIGGATTDIFSYLPEPDREPIYNRTVSANLGMSYSIANVLKEAGVEKISRWLPYEIDPTTVENSLRNKMIRPTSIPQTKQDLELEHAACIEALRLSYIHHKSLAKDLTGGKEETNIGSALSAAASHSLLDSRPVDLLIGSGGVLSHAPEREQTAKILVDSFEPKGICRLAVDSIFMMPHLGVLGSVNEQAALEIFEHDCLIILGSVVAPYWDGNISSVVAEITLEGWGTFPINPGEIQIIEASEATEINAVIEPKSGKINCGKGPGTKFETTLTGGPAGIILDGRNRPLFG